MTLAEIMDEIQEKYPHTLSDASVIRKLDAIHKRVYRLVPKLITTSATMAPGQIWMDNTFFGKTIRPGDIRDFLVDGVSVPYRDVTEEPLPRYYFLVDGKYGVVPKPLGGEKITVFHYKIPPTLTAQSTDVGIDEDFQHILIYGVCKEIAENYQDFDAANGYAIQYNDFVNEYMKHSKPAEPYTIREEWWR